MRQYTAETMINTTCCNPIGENFKINAHTTTGYNLINPHLGG
jgi:hypothetical protein